MKKTSQCQVCGDRFAPWHKRAPRICKPCGEIVLEIERTCGAEFLTMKSVLAARIRQRLAAPLLSAASVAPRLTLAANPKGVSQ